MKILKPTNMCLYDYLFQREIKTMIEFDMTKTEKMQIKIFFVLTKFKWIFMIIRLIGTSLNFDTW